MTYTGYLQLHKPFNPASLDSQLVWMKTELQLDDAQFARIKNLHYASGTRLQELNAKLVQMQGEFATREQIRRLSDRVDFIEFARLVEARQAVARECQNSTHQLILAVANEMHPNQRRQYLSLVAATKSQNYPN
jgi:phosphoglycerate-specific signal transduction histidine kinase